MFETILYHLVLLFTIVALLGAILLLSKLIKKLDYEGATVADNVKLLRDALLAVSKLGQAVTKLSEKHEELEGKQLGMEGNYTGLAEAVDRLQDDMIPIRTVMNRLNGPHPKGVKPAEQKKKG